MDIIFFFLLAEKIMQISIYDKQWTQPQVDRGEAEREYPNIISHFFGGFVNPSPSPSHIILIFGLTPPTPFSCMIICILTEMASPFDTFCYIFSSFLYINLKF